MPNGCWDFGWDYKGGDIKHQPMKNALECACWCAGNPECKKWVYIKGVCFQKKMVTTRSPAKDSVSGQMDCINTLPVKYQNNNYSIPWSIICRSSLYCAIQAILFFINSYTEPAISDDLITKHYISLNTFLFHLLCLMLCFV